ncbi:MAG: CPBP family intramembrane metalloprotease [Anaerolineae bacterium]|nr:CPBP family intramembrane metalloprotease [Anaerolineae bacterium]
MDFSGLIVLGGIFSYVGFTVYVANQVDAAHRIQTAPAYLPSAHAPAGGFDRSTLLRWLLYGLVGMIFMLGLVVLQTAFFGEMAQDLQQELPGSPLPQISLTAGGITFALALAASFASFRLIASETLRERLQRFLARWGGHFNATSQVHLTAAVLMLVVAVYVIVNFVLQGGIEGVAQDIQTNGIEPGDVVFQGVVEVVVTLLGVGLAIRRGLPETLERLGLRWPTREDLVWGVGVGVGFYFASQLFFAVWLALTSPDTLTEQLAASSELNMAFATLPLAFILSTSAALGEEIWIRGGLQPIFGLVVSSIFFATLHTQVALTVGTLIMFVVSLGLGWLRLRHSTSASIIAHFCFNFIQLALLALAVEGTS